MSEARTLPDLQDLWDFGAPAESEIRFREILPRARTVGDADYLGQLLTQIARARGLQDDFDGAHALLDEADELLTDACTIGRIRALLERGRTCNSAGHTGEALALFLKAYVRAYRAEEDFYAVDALHMLGIAAELDDAIEWNELAMTMAERSDDDRARGWLGSLCQNQGYAYLQRGELDAARSCFDRMLAFAEARGCQEDERIARWFIGRVLRGQGRAEEALAIQQVLLEAHAAAETEDEGFIAEEIGECLWALGRRDEARGHLATAHEKLSRMAWLVRQEPDRVSRLGDRAGRAPSAS
jgi:tetratricopeptide (TPR) repeat protein